MAGWSMDKDEPDVWAPRHPPRVHGPEPIGVRWYAYPVAFLISFVLWAGMAAVVYGLAGFLSGL